MQIKTPNTKFITNINWDKDINGLRKVELGDFYSQNIQTTVRNTVALNPITGTNTPATYRDTTNTVDLFLVRKRTIKLYNLWNRILNSGLMQGPTNYAMLTYKAVGSNISHIFTECLNRDNFSGWSMDSISLATAKVFYRLLKFINAAATAYYYYKINGYLTASYFNIFPTSTYGNFSSLINAAFNPTSEKFVSLMDELLDVIKSLLDETKLSAELNLTFNDLYFSTEQGRINITNVLYNYHSKYNLIAKTDSSYLESNLVPQDKTLLYPQFGSVMSRNTESETWNVRNVIVDTSTYNTENNPDLNIYRKPSKIVCSQLKMDRPIKVNTQYINWNDPDDEPYVMVYNGGTFIHIPDEIKNPELPLMFSNLGSYVVNTDTSYTTFEKPVLATQGCNLTGLEFNFTTDDTEYSGYSRVVFGFVGNYGLTISPGSLLGDKIEWKDATIYATGKICDGYKNKSFKIKIANENGKSVMYINDILTYTGATLYNFNQNLKLSNNSDYKANGVTIADIKYIYTPSSNIQPDNQLNIAAKFWKIGTQDTTDPKYNTQDDIKLKLDHPLNELTKFDYFDNLTLYMKLD